MTISKKDLAEKIVDHIRSSDWDEECIWDENEQGAAWVDNEIFLATCLIRKMNNNGAFYPNLEDCKTVEQCQKRLTEFSINDLIFMMKFLEHGGTSNDEFFTLRDHKKRNDIKAWFDSVV